MASSLRIQCWILEDHKLLYCLCMVLQACNPSMKDQGFQMQACLTYITSPRPTSATQHEPFSKVMIIQTLPHLCKILNSIPILGKKEHRMAMSIFIVPKVTCDTYLYLYEFIFPLAWIFLRQGHIHFIRNT